MKSIGSPIRFVDHAYRIGGLLSRAAIRHEGACTWIAEEVAAIDGTWRATARTLDADLGDGTAGVGWFLGRIAALTDDPFIAAIAAEALAHAIAAGDALAAAGRYGLIDGAAGVAWAAIDGGQALGREDLVSAGRQLASRVASDMLAAPPNHDAAGLRHGTAGTLSGLIALSDIVSDPALREAASAAASSLVQEVSRWSVPAHGNGPPPQINGRARVGLADGASGVSLTLAAWCHRTRDEHARDALIAALRIEREWCEDDGWYGAPAHEGMDEHARRRSWCSGAAGLGLARLAAWTATGAYVWLAELGAAIEAIRNGPWDLANLSLCHGTAGQVELLIAAAVTLGEAAHLDAARHVGARIAERTARLGDDRTDAGPVGRHPSLLQGFAGTGLVLLRLEDSRLAPMPVLPGVR